MTVHVNWREDAACRDADPDLFFPIGTTGAVLRHMEEAKTDPPSLSCANPMPGVLAWALENGVADGVGEAPRRTNGASSGGYPENDDH